jgi:hypothetical protein
MSETVANTEELKTAKAEARRTAETRIRKLTKWKQCASWHKVSPLQIFSKRIRMPWGTPVIQPFESLPSGLTLTAHAVSKT